MEQEVKDFFLSPAPSTRSVYTSFDKGHGRIERRILSEELFTTELRCSLKWIRSVWASALASTTIILELRFFFHAEALVRCVLDGDIDRLTASVFPPTINNRR